MRSPTIICLLLLLLPSYLAFGLPMGRQKRSTSEEILGDLVAEEAGLLNLDYVKQSNCKEIYDAGLLKSGVYRLDLNDNKGQFDVFCDMNLRSGGWTIIQRRVDNSTSFNLTKYEYERGFGNLNGNFWLGLDKIHRLTNNNGHTFELYFGLERFGGSGSSKYGKAVYDYFNVGDSASDYQLTVSALDVLESTVSDSFASFHNNTGFSTLDNDVDSDSSRHCAQEFSSGWWYTNCHSSHLNGIYYYDGVHTTSTLDGIIWTGFGDEDPPGTTVESLKSTVMAIRPLS